MALFFFLASLCFDLGVGVGGVGLFAFKSQSMPCFLAFDFQLQDIQLGLSVLELKFSLVESLLQLPDLPLLDFKWNVFDLQQLFGIGPLRAVLLKTPRNETLQIFWVFERNALDFLSLYFHRQRHVVVGQKRWLERAHFVDQTP